MNTGRRGLRRNRAPRLCLLLLVAALALGAVVTLTTRVGMDIGDPKSDPRMTGEQRSTTTKALENGQTQQLQLNRSRGFVTLRDLELVGSAAGRYAAGLLSQRNKGSSAAAKRYSDNTHVNPGKQTVVKKYAAIMFHTSVTSFEAPLVNLEPLLSDQWAVRLFLPEDDSRVPTQMTFEQSKQYLLAVEVMSVLRDKGVEVEVLMHNMTDILPPPRGGKRPKNSRAAGVVASGPVANNFALRRETYDAIPEEHILLYQADGAFCTSSNTRSLDSFMHHPWLGAPWNQQQAKRMTNAQDGSQLNLLYGNGGMSIRSKAFVLDCISREQYRSDWIEAKAGRGLPEDVFFSRCLFEHNKEAVNLEEAAAFSVEEIFLPEANSPLIVHDPCRAANFNKPGMEVHTIGCATESHKYNTRELVRRCPEAKRVISRCVARCGYGSSS